MSVAAERAKNRHLAWLLLVPLGALIAVLATAAAQPMCRCEQLYDVVLPPSPGLSVILILAAGMAGAGIAGAYGLLPRALLAGSKVRWTGGLSALAWVPALAFGCGLSAGPGSAAPNSTLFSPQFGPLILGVALAGFLLTWFVFWLACYLVDCVRHASAGKGRSEVT